jgi:4-diphosphocytidyl-2-C-methyl-D-erythritol kinase
MKTRRVRLQSLAKINLDLRVLNKRPDGFHELRTVFQTISLADTIEIQYEASRRTHLSIDGNVDIPDNLIIRAAQAVLDAMRVHATVRFKLTKRIPMGGGLGGGSSNAAAVLMALPALTGREVSVDKIASELGSDVPFFLTGGTMIGVGRGTELYTLPELAEEPIMVVAPGIHASTGPAYSALDRSLTFDGSSSSINSFQAYVRAIGVARRAGQASALSGNDFEAVVFRQHPRLRTILKRLSDTSSFGARMSGSGSSLFAIFESVAERERARKVLDGDRVFRGCEIVDAKLVSRRSFQRMWRRALQGTHP